MSRYTYKIDADEPFELLSVPKYEGQTLDVCETEEDDVDKEIVRRRFVGCKTKDGALYWEQVPPTYPCSTISKTKTKRKR